MVLSENQIAPLSVCKTQAPFPLKKWGLVLIAELFQLGTENFGSVLNIVATHFRTLPEFLTALSKGSNLLHIELGSDV
jgi:hypothetical protein